MIDLLFLLVAVCPAAAAVGHEMKGKAFVWQTVVVRFAEWFYGITLFNLLVLYLRGAGSFDFSFLSVQFIFKYMLSSMAAVAVLAAVRAVVGRYVN